MKMETLSKDVLFSLALELNLPDLLRFCSSSKRINNLVCNRNDIWYQKLKNEFPDYNGWLRKTPRETYTLLYKLTVVKDKFKINYSLEKLYNKQKLNLIYTKIKEIPKEIDSLINLRKLYLGENQIKEIPKEIGQLVNLQELDLENNEIKEIPKEIGSLVNLRKLYLSENQIKEIPKEIGQLVNLQELWLSYNKIKEIPKELDFMKDIIGIGH